MNDLKKESEKIAAALKNEKVVFLKFEGLNNAVLEVKLTFNKESSKFIDKTIEAVKSAIDNVTIFGNSITMKVWYEVATV